MTTASVENFVRVGRRTSYPEAPTMDVMKKRQRLCAHGHFLSGGNMIKSGNDKSVEYTMQSSSKIARL